MEGGSLMDQFIGVDIHRKFLQVCVMDSEGLVSDEIRLEMDDPSSIVDFFGRFPAQTPVVVEATCGWMWLADLLESLGLDVRLAHMKGVRVIAESRRKTDRIDARVLADLMRTNYLPEAYLAPREVRDLRMILRHRESLVGWRTAVKNKVHGLLMRQNIHIAATDIFGAAGRRMLGELELPVAVRRIMDQHLSAIEFLDRQIQAVGRRLYEQLPGDRRVGLLTSLPGVGKLTAHFILGEIGTVDRFLSASKFVSYCGLCPSTRESGSWEQHGSTKGSGRRLLKWALVEASHTAVRRDPYFARTFHRVAGRRGRGKAYVAVARKMSRIIWQLLKEKRPYVAKRSGNQVGSSRAMTDGA
jgi:transposase